MSDTRYLQVALKEEIRQPGFLSRASDADVGRVTITEGLARYISLVLFQTKMVLARPLGVDGALIRRRNRISIIPLRIEAVSDARYLQVALKGKIRQPGLSGADDAEPCVR